MASGGAKEATASPFLRISDVAQESLEFLPPIGGYAKQPLVSLEEAVKSLISILPDVESHVYVAKQKCKNPADDLTQDESASIMLYTMEWEPHDECLYVVLNNTLRSKNRNKTLKLWYPYLRLFLNALYRLPPIANTFYRGVKENLIERYKKDSTVVWWGFSSCTKAVGVLNNDSFLGKTGERTLFTVRCNSARDISKHSMFETEAEVLLLAATQFQVVDCLDQGGLHIIQLEETIPPAPLLQPVPIIGSLPESSIKISAPATSPNAAMSTNSFTEIVKDKFSSNTSSSTTSYSQISAMHNNTPISVERTILNISASARWKQNGTTIAGGNEAGRHTDQLREPYGLFVATDRTIFIADFKNQRIVKWAKGDTNGEVVIGGSDQEKRLNHLKGPSDVLFNKETNTVIISDHMSRRVLRWSLNDDTRVETLIDNINCWGLAMDDEGFLYVSDWKRCEVRRYRLGDPNGTLVAGGNNDGNNLNQFKMPTYLFVDKQQNLYVSDRNNHRVMKWNKGAREGVVVAGDQGQGNSSTQLNTPYGIYVDTSGTLYVVDSLNTRVMRWPAGGVQGTVVVGGNGSGPGANQLKVPVGLSFDEQCNLYVADCGNSRIQRFSIETSR